MPDRWLDLGSGPSSRVKYWAFVANPERYDILAALQEGKDTWLTAGYDMHAGDRGLIWKAAGRKGRRGVVSLVEITSQPEVMSDEENPRWVASQGLEAPAPRVSVRYVRAPELPLWEPDAFLEGLNVSRARGSTVLPLSEEVWAEVLRRSGGWEDAGLSHRHYMGSPVEFPLIAGGQDRARPVIMLGDGKARARLPPPGWHRLRVGERDLWAKLVRVALNKVTATPDASAPNLLAEILEEWYGPEPWAAGKKHRVEFELVEPDVLEMRPAKDKLWTREEMLLALDLHVNRPAGLEGARDKDIQALGDFLGRTRGSVGLKIGNFKSVDPDYTSTGRTGLPNKASLEEALFAEWAHRPAELRAEAVRIREKFFGALDEAPDALDRGSFWDKLGAMTPEELERFITSRRNATRDERQQSTTTRRGGVARVGQAAFAQGVLAGYYLHAPPEHRNACPGCGHARLKANDAPVLEAHHVVPFAETQSMDVRWGVPVCLNCHELLDAGELIVKREIYASIAKRYPQFQENLRELVAEGAVKDVWLRLMVSEGALPKGAQQSTSASPDVS